MRRSECFPTADLTFARLARGETEVYRLLDGLIDRFHRQTEHCSDSRRLRWAEMRDVVDSMLVKADGFNEIDLYLIAGNNTTNQIPSTFIHGLRYRKDRRDVVAGMRIISRQKSVMQIQFADSCAVRPGGPLWTEKMLRRNAKYSCAAYAWMAKRHRAG